MEWAESEERKHRVQVNNVLYEGNRMGSDGGEGVIKSNGEKYIQWHGKWNGKADMRTS